MTDWYEVRYYLVTTTSFDCRPEEGMELEFISISAIPGLKEQILQSDFRILNALFFEGKPRYSARIDFQKTDNSHTVLKESFQ